MPTVEDLIAAYEEATDSTRHLLRVRDDARQWQRVKPDPETHPEAAFDHDHLAGVHILAALALRAAARRMLSAMMSSITLSALPWNPNNEPHQ